MQTASNKSYAHREVLEVMATRLDRMEKLATFDVKSGIFFLSSEKLQKLDC